MNRERPHLLGMELYFEDLSRAREFYLRVLGLDLKEEAAGHFARFDGGGAFLCLEKKGTENYASSDKAVIFLEVTHLAATLERIGRKHVVHEEPARGLRAAWAVLHDPEGHNVLLLEKRPKKKRR